MHNFQYYTPTKKWFWKGHGKTDRISCKGAGEAKVPDPLRRARRDTFQCFLTGLRLHWQPNTWILWNWEALCPIPGWVLVYEGIELCKKRALISSWPLEAEAPSDSTKAIGYGAVNEAM